MANNLQGNPLWVDTASASPIVLEVANQHTMVWVAAISFTGYTTGATDQAVLSFRTDAHTFILQGTANKDTITINFGPEGIPLRDIVVSTLTSGRVAIWLTGKG